MRALLLENIHPEAERLLGERGIEVRTAKGALDTDELVAALDGVQLLGIRSKTTVTEEVLERAPDLLAVGAHQIDHPATDGNLEPTARAAEPLFELGVQRALRQLADAHAVTLGSGATDRLRRECLRV